MLREYAVSETVYNNIKEHAIDCYPNECCGVILRGNEYKKLINIASNKTDSVLIHPEEWSSVIAKSEDDIIFIHSHPDWWPVPSAADMLQQESMGIPWGIISVKKYDEGYTASPVVLFGEHTLDQEIVGCGFIHGVNDCYELIRRWYWQEKKIKLQNFPRDWEWWNQDHDLYRKGFGAAGFRVINVTSGATSPMMGDVFLAQIRSPVPNHGGIYVGNGLGLHHMSGRSAYQPETLSKHEPILRYQPYITLWLRHESNPTDG